MMGALLRLAAFELRIHLRRISTWVFFGVFFLTAFLMTASLAGAWPAHDLGDPALVANSPMRIARMVLALGTLGVLVTAGMLGTAVHRDFQVGIHPLFFTTPTPKAAYLGGRYLGGVAANLLVFLGIPAGIAAAAAMPFVDPGRVVPFDPPAYLQAIGLFMVPNLLFTGAIFLMLAAVTRQMMPNYAAGMLLLLGYGMSLILMAAIDQDWATWTLDPFGTASLRRATRYWTLNEQNWEYLPMGLPVLVNRAVWLGVGALVFAVGATRFRFSHFATERERDARRGPAEERGLLRPLEVPAADRSFGWRARAAQWAAVLRRSLREVVTNVYFPIIAGCCMTFVLLAASQIGSLYGTRTYPVTYEVLELLFGTFFLFVVVVITFYAGELVWYERERKAAQLHDSMPVPDWVPLTAKLAALTGVVVAMLAAAMTTGILIQVTRGYFRFEAGLYLRELFLHQLALYLPLVVLAIAVQSFVNHKYVGHFVMLLYYVGSPILYTLGLEHNLFHYASSPEITYSDMNGYGHGVTAVFWFSLFWMLVAVLLAVASNLFWVRGQEPGSGWRLRLARLRATRPLLTAAAVALLLVLSTGGFIVYNTTVLNEWSTGEESERVTARYEKEYKRFERMPQPRVTAVSLALELYPERQEFRARGTYRLVNRTGVPVDSVFVDYPSNLKVRAFGFDRPATRLLADEEGGFFAFRLERPLAPGDSALFRFDLADERRGFENDPAYGPVVGNGTFFNNFALPKIGYNAEGELADEGARERLGLPPRPRAASIHDRRARMRNDISYDADWIGFDVTVGTSADQRAVAPGYLQREWTDRGRRYFHYRMDAPILNFFAVLSARYVVKRDRWNGVAIEVFHHPGHEYNVDRMIRSVKRSLDYYTREFGPYQHRQVRILEFPRFAAFAQSFANTIPYSEAIGFIADVRREDIDYPFFVTAHEVAHQWWGHQVVGADVQGSAMLSETLAEYSALMVMEKEYGREQIGRFLRFELDGYLTGRGGERRGEMPLVLVENQQYIHYNKGALAMYALRDYIGEARLNGALRAFLEKARYSGPPYPTSLDLLGHLRAATPDSLRYVVDDLFQHVTLYDARARSATARPDGDGWVVDLAVTARKLRADSAGVEDEVPMRDWVDVGVFSADTTEPVYLRKHRVRSGEQTIRVRVSQEPVRAGIDPLNKLIDREMDDNVVTVRRMNSAEREPPPTDSARGDSTRDSARPGQARRNGG